MNTQSTTNQVGVYGKGVPFTVYQVYPEKDGIVWGRVSSNTGEGTSRYVGLRVVNQIKAHLEKAFEQVLGAEEKTDDGALLDAIRLLITEMRLLVAELRARVIK
jgi:hypothetical protein